MTQRTEERLVTAQELYARPDDGMRHELVAGRLLSEPPAGFEHGAVGLQIGRILREYCARQGLGVVCGSDTGFVLARSPDTVRAPDAAFVRQERIPPRDRRKEFFEGAPDLAVEVLSPGDRSAEVRAKVAEYLAAGCRAVWVGDPETMGILVYRSLFAPRMLGSEDLLDGEDYIPGLSVRVSDLFKID